MRARAYEQVERRSRFEHTRASNAWQGVSKLRGLPE